ncbi:MAG: hypothetical protein IGS48_21055 [Oscillatoriales cyanobacterium C42_A2020_001]|nr:hypothetical protein [Leptolyngbyaceae cyanobacterium C42_A2020_001]
MSIAQVIEAQTYSLAELRWQLSRVRGKRVPARTLRWWLRELYIEPNEFGMYATEDLKVLTRLVVFLKRCRSLTKFKQLLIQKMETHANEHRSAQEFDEWQNPRTAQSETPCSQP